MRDGPVGTRSTVNTVLGAALVVPLLLASLAGAEPGLPEDLVAVYADNYTPSPLSEKTLVRDTIDPHAQRVLREMSGDEDPELHAFAILMARAAVRGVISGIYLENTRVPVLRAKAQGISWWKIIPNDRSAICWKEPADDAPVIVFDDAVKDDDAALSRALREAFADCDLGYLVVDAVNAGAAPGSSQEYRSDCEVSIEPKSGYRGTQRKGDTTAIDSVRPGSYTARVRCDDGEKSERADVSAGAMTNVRIDPKPQAKPTPARKKPRIALPKDRFKKRMHLGKKLRVGPKIQLRSDGDADADAAAEVGPAPDGRAFEVDAER